jgi:hypothetical protein
MLLSLRVNRLWKSPNLNLKPCRGETRLSTPENRLRKALSHGKARIASILSICRMCLSEETPERTLIPKRGLRSKGARSDRPSRSRQKSANQECCEDGTTSDSRWAACHAIARSLRSGQELIRREPTCPLVGEADALQPRGISTVPHAKRSKAGTERSRFMTIW